jgi:hypothetical protein
LRGVIEVELIGVQAGRCYWSSNKEKSIKISEILAEWIVLEPFSPDIIQTKGRPRVVFGCEVEEGDDWHWACVSGTSAGEAQFGSALPPRIMNKRLFVAHLLLSLFILFSYFSLLVTFLYSYKV